MVDENTLFSTPVPTQAPALDLIAIEAEHARWLATEGREGKRANLRGVDLSHLDLSGRLFSQASLRGVLFVGSNLSGTDLRGADLAESVFDGAILNGAFFTGASLTRAQLHQASAIEADFTTADLTGCIAEGIHLVGARMNGALLRDANFRHGDFTHATLRDANLRGATIMEANLSGADLSGADCRDVNFDRSHFVGAVLKDTNFRAAKLAEVDIQAADFSVALDVGSEFQSQSLQSERSRIQEEQAQLVERFAALGAEQKALDEKYRQIADLEARQANHAVVLEKLAGGFTARFVAWLLIAVLVTGFTLYRASQLDIARIAGVLGVAVLVVGLALVSMLRSRQVAKILKDFTAAPAEEALPPVSFGKK